MRSKGKRELPPLNAEKLERLALRYVERYATTRTKLADYLRRKLRERGWDGEIGPNLDPLVAKFASLGYVDDKAFATARSGALLRRGLGPRRISQALRAAGIGEDDRADAEEASRIEAWSAALDFARRRRIGPFATQAPDRQGRDKAFAAMLRAGHGTEMVKRLVDAQPGDIPQWDKD